MVSLFPTTQVAFPGTTIVQTQNNSVPYLFLHCQKFSSQHFWGEVKPVTTSLEYGPGRTPPVTKKRKKYRKTGCVKSRMCRNKTPYQNLITGFGRFWQISRCNYMYKSFDDRLRCFEVAGVKCPLPSRLKSSPLKHSCTTVLNILRWFRCFCSCFLTKF